MTPGDAHAESMGLSVPLHARNAKDQVVQTAPQVTSLQMIMYEQSGWDPGSFRYPYYYAQAPIVRFTEVYIYHIANAQSHFNSSNSIINILSGS